MGKFDAALTTLNVSLAQLDYVGEDCDGVKKSMAQIESAMRVLESAGEYADSPTIYTAAKLCKAILDGEPGE